VHSEPERCVPVSVSSSGAQEVPSVFMGGQDLPVYLPALWPFQCPKGIYKAAPASHGPFMERGSSFNNISGRLAFDVSPEGSPHNQGGGDNCPVGELGILDKQGEVSAMSVPESHLFGFCGGLPIVTSTRQTVSSETGLQGLTPPRNSSTERTSQDSRHAVSNSAGSVAGPSLLPSSAAFTDPVTQMVDFVRHTGDLGLRCQAGPRMVDLAP